MYNPFTLENKTILVTGASSGIGRAIAVECSRMGAKVLLTARNKERLVETLSLMDKPELHRIILCDLSEIGTLSELLDDIQQPLDGVVHCAGFIVTKPFSFVKESEIDSIMGVNFKAPILLTQQLLKAKKLVRGSSVVFISSISGVWISTVGNNLYAASKGAVNGIVMGIALELAAKSIRVNCINPGMVNTHIMDNTAITDEQLKEDVKRYPLGRYGNPEDVAYAAVYLLSDASSWMTGSNIKIDGGYTLL